MMTVHVLHAGDGYTYLTRQVATGDHLRSRGQGLTDYYAASGEPPGRWAGRGTTTLGMHGLVETHQMQALYGEGLHPEADRLVRELTAQGMSAGDAVNATRLGRRFPQFANDTAFKRAYGEAVEQFRRDHGRGADDDERVELRTRVAQSLVADEQGAGVQDPRIVQEYLADARRAERQPAAGYDLVFSPPKSVSTLWAVSDRATQEAIAGAHEAAWRSTLEYLEQNAALTRKGAAGVAQINTNGLVTTAFDHRTSRTGDPDLHTHLVIANRVEGTDGKWRALDARVLHSLGVSASETYNSRLEDALVERLGVEFQDVGRADGKRPVREIVGVDQALMRSFSRRRAGIEDRYTELLAEFRVQYGRDPSRAVQVQLAQQATLETRGRKEEHRPLNELVQEWRAQAQSVLADGSIDAMLANVRAGTVDNIAPQFDASAVAAQVIGVVSGERATWNRWHVRAEAERQLRPYRAAGAAREAMVAAVEHAALGPGESIQLTIEPDPLPAELTRDDGTSVFRVHGSEIYTSQAILDAEQRLLAAARTPEGPVLNLAPTPEVESALADLNDGQRQLVQHFTGAGTAVAVGIGPAGAGKTTAMKAVTQLWTMGGGRVIGLAPSAAAAAVLSSELGVNADTVARLLTQHRVGVLPAETLTAGDMLLVDEAGMAATADLDQLRALASERGAVLRLLGDYRQASAVAAGGALRLIANDVGAAELNEVHRFRDPQEATATLALREGDETALSFYLRRGRVHDGTTITMTDQVYQDWADDRAAGRTSLMMAVSNETVQALNVRARADRVAAGLVQDQGVQIRHEHLAGVGDTIVTRLNDRTIPVSRRGDFIRNGDLWTVLALRPDGGLDVQRLDGGARAQLPTEYVASSVELGYATTISRAQGATVDRARVLVEPGMTREQLYVALTRGRATNEAYVPVEAHLDLDLHESPEGRTDAMSVLAGVLHRESGERSATDQMREELNRVERLSTLVPQYLHAVDLLRPQVDYQASLSPTFGEQEAARILAEPTADGLRVELRRLATAGVDVAAAVRGAAQERELGSADSIAQVLQWRLAHTTLPGQEQLGGSPVPLPWLPPVPEAAGEPSELHRWATRQARAISHRAAELGAAAVTDRPTWTDNLGIRPPEAHAAEAWDHAAALEAGYRDQYGVEDSAPTGADDSGSIEQRAARKAVFDAALVAVSAGRRAAQPPTPEPAPPAAELSEAEVPDALLLEYLANAEANEIAQNRRVAMLLQQAADVDRAIPYGHGPAQSAVYDQLEDLRHRASQVREFQAAADQWSTTQAAIEETAAEITLTQASLDDASRRHRAPLEERLTDLQVRQEDHYAALSEQAQRAGRLQNVVGSSAQQQHVLDRAAAAERTAQNDLGLAAQRDAQAVAGMRRQAAAEEAGSVELHRSVEALRDERDRRGLPMRGAQQAPQAAAESPVAGQAPDYGAAPLDLPSAGAGADRGVER